MIPTLTTSSSRVGTKLGATGLGGTHAYEEAVGKAKVVGQTMADIMEDRMKVKKTIGSRSKSGSQPKPVIHMLVEKEVKRSLNNDDEESVDAVSSAKRGRSRPSRRLTGATMTAKAQLPGSGAAPPTSRNTTSTNRQHHNNSKKLRIVMQ